ncbi:MAG: VWA domain-containing protein, partial [bacterium]|nr:VWA domain-containing protein [bacterium]
APTSPTTAPAPAPPAPPAGRDRAPCPPRATGPEPSGTLPGTPPDDDGPPPDDGTPPDGDATPPDGDATPPAPPPGTDPGPPTTPPALDEGVWLDGEPVWVAPYDDDPSAAAAAAAPAEEAAAAPATAPAPEPAPPPPAMVVADEMADEEVAEGDDFAGPMADEAGAEAIEAAPGSFQESLTGGAIDDNERFEDYLVYRQEILSLGIPVRDLDPAGRIVVTVTGRDGLPAAGTEVQVTAGEVEATLRTTADGTVRFHPEAYGAGDGPFTITAGGTSGEVSRGGSLSLETDLPAAGDEVTLDVLFLLDATGSMADEIDQLKATIREVAQRIANLPAGVDLRIGMTLYRDVGDTFVTANFNFTSDVDRFTRALGVVVADGGGDYPEALDEALAEALGRPTWRAAGQALQLIFLIADAPPQINRPVPTPYTASMLDAAARGIKIFPVSSSGTDDQAEFVFRQLAQFTGARYVFLTDGAGGRATGDGSSISERDYEELSLNDLIVRLVAEEIAALGGARTTGDEG